MSVFFLAYSQAGWDELEPGKYEFPFALKVCLYISVRLFKFLLTHSSTVSQCELSTFNGRAKGF